MLLSTLATMGWLQQLSIPLVTVLPRRTLSRATGWFASRPLPRPLRGPAYRLFSACTGIDVTEARRELHEYPSLASWFARDLAARARPIAPGSAAVWPCDGTILGMGRVGEGALFVKAGRFSVRRFLDAAPPTAARIPDDHAFVSLYLSLRDYHRVHAPCSGTIRSIHPIDGDAYPVHSAARARWPDALWRNARLRFEIEEPGGQRLTTVTMVGAFNVSALETRRRAGEFVHRGEELGRFELGSAVIWTSQELATSSVPEPGAHVSCRTEVQRGPKGRSGQ